MLILIPTTLYAGDWKELKDLKSFVKTSNIGKGRELIAKCLKDTLINKEPELYRHAIALETKANDAENMKLYLKQKYDTVAFFNTTYCIFDYSLKLEQALQNINPQQALKAKKKNAVTLKPYYPNLYSGGVFFVKNKNWALADKILSMYIDVTQSEMFNEDKNITMARLPRAAFLDMRSCYEEKKYRDVFKYTSLAEADSANLDYVLQYEALSYEQLKDTTNYVKTLKRGLNELNESDYFFSRLTDFLNGIHHYQSACTLNDSLLTLRPDNKLYLYAQTVALFNMNAYDNCIKNTERLLQLEPENFEALYYIGLCWYNKGVGYENTLSPDPTSKDYKKRKAEVNQMFTKAMPYLEKFRETHPNDKEKWQAPLYKIYFSLNMSNKLKELEK